MPDPDRLTKEFFQTFMERIMLNIHRISQRIEK